MVEDLRGVGKVRTKVMHCIRVRIEVGFLIDEEWLEQIAKEVWVTPQEEWYGWEDDVHGIDIST